MDKLEAIEAAFNPESFDRDKEMFYPVTFLEELEALGFTVTEL